MSFRYERALDLIERAAEKGRLAHAYLLAGPQGSGKERLAVRMVEMANPSGREAPPDSLDALRSRFVAVVAPESKSRRISVDAIRSLEHVLQMAAPTGVTKFAIVREADRLGPEASNAFLKTLEEPPSSSRILLLTSRPEMLLETILSRCIRVPLAGQLLPETPGEGVSRFLALLAEQVRKGKPGYGGAALLQGAFVALLKSEKESVEKANAEAAKAEAAPYKKTTDGNYLKDREEYWNALTASEYLDRRNRILEYLISWFGDALRHRQGVRHLDLPDYSEATAALAGRSSLEDLIRRLAAVEELRSHLGTNANETLALDVAFLRAFG